MTTEVGVKCETCIFRKRISRVSYVRCMRYPPVFDHEVTDWIRPDMAKDDWCGEWQGSNKERVGG